MHYVLARRDLFLNSVGDVELLPAVLRAASCDIALPDEAVMAAQAGRLGLSSIFGL